MALTVSVPYGRNSVWGNLRVAVATFTFDADLDEAGEAINAADVGLSEIYTIIPQPQAQSTSGAEVTAPVHVKEVSATQWTAHLIISTTDFGGDDLDASTYSFDALDIGV